MNTRQTILVSVAILLVGAVGVWWYLGFTLDFMRFFAAEPSSIDTTSRLCDAPPGCTCQVVQCIQAPCDPIIVCPDTTGGIVRCAPDSQTVTVNSGAQFSATGGTGAYEWFAPDGIIAMADVAPGGTVTTNNFMVAYQTAGTKKVTVQAPRGDGSGNVDSVACTVIVTGTQAQ